MTASTAILQPTADDLAHFAASGKGYPHLLIETNEIRQRIIMERAVIRRAVADLIAAGHWLRVSYGGGDFGCERTDNLDIVMEAVCACDDEHLYVYDNSSSVRRGWVYLVYGNDGWDVMSDYTVNLERALKGANDYADKLGDATVTPADIAHRLQFVGA